MIILRLPPLRHILRVHQLHIIPMYHTSQHNRLLQITNIPSNAPPGPGAKRNEIRPQLLALLPEPPVGIIRLRIGEHLLVPVRHVCRHLHRHVARDVLAVDAGALGRRLAGEALGCRGRDAEGFVDAGAEEREVADFGVGGDDFGFVEDGVDFGAQARHVLRVLEEVVHHVCDGDGGGGGAGIHHYRDFGDDFAPFQVVGDAVLVGHQRLEEVVEFLVGAVAGQTLVGEVQVDAVPVVVESPELAVVGGEGLGEPDERRIPAVVPDQVGGGARVGIEGVAVVGLPYLARWGDGGAAVAALVEEAEFGGETDVGDGVEGEEVGPGAVIDFVVGVNVSGPGIELAEHAGGLVGYLVLPVFEVLKSVGRGHDLSLTSVVCLVDYIRQVVVGTGEELILWVLSTWSAVAVNILDGLEAVEGETIRASAKNPMASPLVCLHDGL